MGVTLAAAELVALGGEPALELGDHSVDSGEILDRSARQGAVELVERALRRQRGGALDHGALELAPQLLLESPQLLTRNPVTARIVLGQLGLRLGAQPKRATDPLHIHSEHARSLT